MAEEREKLKFLTENMTDEQRSEFIRRQIDKMHDVMDAEIASARGKRLVERLRDALAADRASLALARETILHLDKRIAILEERLGETGNEQTTKH